MRVNKPLIISISKDGWLFVVMVKEVCGLGVCVSYLSELGSGVFQPTHRLTITAAIFMFFHIFVCKTNKKSTHVSEKRIYSPPPPMNTFHPSEV